MIAHYAVEHNIRLDYSSPVEGSVMTLFMCPLRDRTQVLRQFSLSTSPEGQIFELTDPFGNVGHFFDRLAAHESLDVKARFLVEVGPLAEVPDRLGPDGWGEIKGAVETPELWPMLHPSPFVHFPLALRDFMEKHNLSPEDDPLATARNLCMKLHQILEYTPGSTRADSPIEHILQTGQGVCQDYAHLMTSILRHWGIPCRYVSGHLGPLTEDVETSQGVGHAWVECWFPRLGWIGFDPTNDGAQVGMAHIRVAVGRDYSDIPPSRGIFRGGASSTIETEVVVRRCKEGVLL